jgi:uncharacterized protein YuzE
MAVYTYDEEDDSLYISLGDEDEDAVDQTVEMNDCLSVDLDGSGQVIGIEVLNPSTQKIDLTPVLERFGIEIRMPFSFAA